jgi:hypothetical protein
VEALGWRWGLDSDVYSLLEDRIERRVTVTFDNSLFQEAGFHTRETLVKLENCSE